MKQALGRGNCIVGLKGGLGAGKTTFTRALLYAMGLDKNEPVTSPTFTYIQEYFVNSISVFHLDLYRFETEVRDLEDLGLDLDYVNGTYIVLIEWFERLSANLQKQLTHTLEFQEGPSDIPSRSSDDYRRILLVSK